MPMLRTGLRSGTGTLTKKKSGEVYEGGWLKGRKHGAGKLTDKNGLVTNGKWHMGALGDEL